MYTAMLATLDPPARRRAPSAVPGGDVRDPVRTAGSLSFTSLPPLCARFSAILKLATHRRLPFQEWVGVSETDTQRSASNVDRIEKVLAIGWEKSKMTSMNGHLCILEYIKEAVPFQNVAIVINHGYAEEYLEDVWDVIPEPVGRRCES